MKTLKIFLFLFCAVIAAQSVNAQTTAFTYQGSLNSGATPANGNHDFEFALFDTVSGGAQVGSTVIVGGVAVTNGVFSVNLNFGSQFPGANRFLEIRVRQTGGGAYTTLSPRNPVNSSPYAVKSLTADTAATSTTSTNAMQLGGVAANQYILTGDARLSDARNPLPGSANYVQNQNANPQSSTSFNISGHGNVGGNVSATQYDINNLGRLIAANSSNNLAIGIQSGNPSVNGGNNTFLGFRAGSAATSTSGGFANSFFGAFAGENSVSGGRNSFFGAGAGLTSNGAESNSMIGFDAGRLTTFGSFNSFFGDSAGRSTTEGTNNSFFGSNSGLLNTMGHNNTLIGAGANVSGGNLINATAIGYLSSVGASNSLVLGSINGVNDSSFDTNVGIGLINPSHRLHVVGNGFFSGNLMVNSGNLVVNGGNVGIGVTPSSYRLEVAGRIQLRQNLGNTGSNNTAGIWFFQNTPNQERAFIGMENDNSVGLYGNNGGGWGLVMSTSTGIAKINALGAAGTTTLCRNASNEISTCGSSLRYKSNVDTFSSGLSLIKKLRPVSFNWTEGGKADMGLVAEEVNAVEPLLATTNDKGEVEGVKYDRVSVVLVNAVNEQQLMIESLKKELSEQSEMFRLQNELIKKQQSQLEAMKMLICSQNPSATLCIK